MDYELINISGVEYKLCYNNRALFCLCNILNKSRSELYDYVSSGDIRIEDEVELIYAGLTKYHPDFNKALLWDLDNMAVVSLPVIRAFSRYFFLPEQYKELFPKNEDEKKKKRSSSFLSWYFALASLIGQGRITGKAQPEK